MSSQYREFSQNPMSIYQYASLGHLSNFSCGNYCTCRNSNQRTAYDIMMYNIYSKPNIKSSCNMPGCVCKNCQCPSCDRPSAQ